MEFLVRLVIMWPVDGDETSKSQLIAAESARADELIRSGHLLRIWRTVGVWGNTGLWSTQDATELHALITSLPLFRWMRVDVEPLARHPSDPGHLPGNAGRSKETDPDSREP